MSASVWSFNLRHGGVASDSDASDGEDGLSRAGTLVGETELIKDLDLASREETVEYKPNPWTIAKINAASRQPAADDQHSNRTARKADVPLWSSEGPIFDAFRKQAQKPVRSRPLVVFRAKEMSTGPSPGISCANTLRATTHDSPRALSHRNIAHDNSAPQRSNNPADTQSGTPRITTVFPVHKHFSQRPVHVMDSSCVRNTRSLFVPRKPFFSSSFSSPPRRPSDRPVEQARISCFSSPGNDQNRQGYASAKPVVKHSLQHPDFAGNDSEQDASCDGQIAGPHRFYKSTDSPRPLTYSPTTNYRPYGITRDDKASSSYSDAVAHISTVMRPDPSLTSDSHVGCSHAPAISPLKPQQQVPHWLASAMTGASPERPYAPGQSIHTDSYHAQDEPQNPRETVGPTKRPRKRSPSPDLVKAPTPDLHARTQATRNIQALNALRYTGPGPYSRTDKVVDADWTTLPERKKSGGVTKTKTSGTFKLPSSLMRGTGQNACTTLGNNGKTSTARVITYLPPPLKAIRASIESPSLSPKKKPERRSPRPPQVVSEACKKQDMRSRAAELASSRRVVAQLPSPPTSSSPHAPRSVGTSVSARQEEDTLSKQDYENMVVSIDLPSLTANYSTIREAIASVRCGSNPCPRHTDPGLLGSRGNAQLSSFGNGLGWTVAVLCGVTKMVWTLCRKYAS